MTFNTGETTESLRQEYNPEGSVLREVQNRMLEMLLYLDETCKKLGIQYRLDGGSVLGAVRHGGFIPWDDDMDVSIMRKDWEKLIKYMKENPHPQFVLQDHSTDSGFYRSWAKIRDKKSRYMRYGTVEMYENMRGAQLDLFPFEEGRLDTFYTVCKFFEWLNIHYFIGKCKPMADFTRFLSLNVSRPVFNVITKVVGKKGYQGHSYGAPWSLKFPNEICWPAKPIEFEGHMVMGPADPVGLCKLIYGKNWGNLPPKEKREVHADEIELL